ncbi:hypothetical protein I4U23_004015 [Adineta vaga]|nr:hypothetical protein I4U23_004015 [Adineta vaga]
MSNDQLQLTNLNTFNRQTITRRIRSIDKTPIIYYSSDDAWRCNRGISIRIQTDVNRSRLYCLCPPSYYGDECQYQNQRVSITVQIRVSSNWRNLYVFLLTLIDHERNIESYDYIEYLPIRDCDTRYNTYLLYSSRPKNFSKTYSVQITAYDQTKLTHRTSWIFPLQFSFLPVYSLPVFLKMSTLLIESANKQCSPSCIHGQCLSYINNQSLTYCHCESSWSGIQCNVKHKCNCALGSLCISDTICLCSSGRFGRRCYLVQMTCQTQPCLNGGQCIVEDVRYNDANQNRSICICLEGYTGDRCQYQQNQTEIQLLFDNLKTIPSFAFVHLILVRKDATPKRITLMKKIRFDEYSIKLTTSIPFHIAFVQIFVDEYYLIIVRENVIISEQISTKFLSSSRCRSITELFDEKFSKQHLIKRIKYYHIPCREIIELNCFYDEVHLCLCTNDRQANCFEFDYNKTYDCDGTNICEHSGKCFLDDDHCPTSSVCTCPNCFFGSKCQYSTQGSTLSLDIILGYHIRPNLLFYQQRIIVKIALILMSFIFVFGVINSFLSFQTFRQEQVQNVGCGLYLYTSSIISMMIILFLTLKFSFLLIIQMNFVSNRTFYYIQCLSIDFILRSLVCTTDWLSAFVALERAINAMMGVTFNKMKSKQMAKRIIWLILIFSSISFMYDPLHRDLSTDEEEEHTWCVTKYSSTMRIIDRIMNIFHFSIPFLINLLSAIVIIFTVARTRSQSQKTKSYEEHLCSQIQYHKHLLISPFLLILLAIPRLIISFVSSCMQSARNAWFYLFGYFISFIPSMLAFEIFVLPSEMYRKEFKKWTSRR